MDYKLNASEWRVLQALWGHAAADAHAARLQFTALNRLVGQYNQDAHLAHDGQGAFCASKESARGSIIPRSRSRMRHIPRRSSCFLARSAEILGYS